MTFEDLQKANATIATTNIKGKEYAEVNQRIKAFRMLFPMGSITTEIISLADGVCVMRATVCDEDGHILGTGTAYEKENSSTINRTSYIENCETSCIGRGLAAIGIGIDTSVASAEEVQNAIAQQEIDAANNKKIDDAKVAALTNMLSENGITTESVFEYYKVSSLADLTVAQFMSIKGNIEKKAKKK